MDCRGWSPAAGPTAGGRGLRMEGPEKVLVPVREYAGLVGSVLQGSEWLCPGPPGRQAGSASCG